MCFDSSSKQSTEAKQTVKTTNTTNNTTTDYGAIQSAVAIFQSAEDLAKQTAITPEQQTQQLMLLGVVLIAALFAVSGIFR